MIPFHPYADLFPLIEGAEFDALVADIQANGIREPIMILDGKILDGRNRYRAGLAAGFFIPSEEGSLLPRPQYLFDLFDPSRSGDPLAWVISKNLKRRHLNDDQRRMIAARIANMGRGRPAENPAECGIKLADAARLVNVDAAGAERARTVIARAAPEVQRAIEHGKLSVAAAVQAAKLAPDVQKKIADEAEAGRAHVVRNVIKSEARASREAELAQKQRALPSRRYGVILADPEWRFEPYSRASGMDRAADNHYPTSATAAIAARNVAAIAATDCALFLWATAPMLLDALAVMEAWGFSYRTHFIWAKDRIGTGYWNRNRHELLLVGARGHVPAPAMGAQWESVIAADVRAHSVKPDAFYDLIESYFPRLPKIELNARRARPGWDAWGYEAPKADPSSSAVRDGSAELNVRDMDGRDEPGHDGERIDDDRQARESRVDGGQTAIDRDLPLCADGARGLGRYGACGKARAAGEEGGGGTRGAPATLISSPGVRGEGGERSEPGEGRIAKQATPLPDPPPQGGREQIDDGLDLPDFLKRDSDNVPAYAKGVRP